MPPLILQNFLGTRCDFSIPNFYVFPTNCIKFSITGDPSIQPIVNPTSLYHQKDMGQCAAKNVRTARDDEHVDFTRGNVHLVTMEDDWDRKLSEVNVHGKIVIANFTATWCRPCRMIAPFYSNLSEMHPSIMFLVVDVDELVEYRKSWEIEATPTFFFLKDGQKLDKLVGANKPELMRMLNSIHSSSSSPLQLQPHN